MAVRKSAHLRKYSEKEIASDLENYLREQRLPANALIAPASRLSQRYNVSAATVNRAIDRLVERKILYRIQGCGTFTARNIDEQKRLRIAIILHDTRNDSSNLYWQVAFGNLNIMLQQNVQMSGHSCSFYFHRIPFLNSEFVKLPIYEFDAVICQSGHTTKENREFLRRFNIPVIQILGDRINRSIDYHQVVFNFIPGYRKLLTHLREMGHERFLIAGIEPGRTEAILQAAEELNIPLDCFEQKSCKGYHLEYWHTVESAHGIAEYFLANRDHFSVILSTSDYISRGIIDYLAGHNLVPGEDYAIASYDNFEKHGVMIYGDKPVLTSISHPQEKMAEAAVKLAVTEALEPSGVKHIIEVPAQELTIRASSNYKHKTNRKR